MNSTVLKSNADEKNYCNMQIIIGHHIDSWMTKDLCGMTSINLEDGTAFIEGKLPDMSAVYGFLNRIRDLAFDVHSIQVTRISCRD